MKVAGQNLKNRRNKKESVGVSNILSMFLSVVFLGLSGLLLMNSVKSVSTAHQRNQLLEQAEGEVQGLRLRNLELLQELDYVTSSAYVEEEARNRLLYTKDDEVLVVLPQTGEKLDGDAVFGEEADGDDPEEDVEGGESGWIQWWSLIRDGV